MPVFQDALSFDDGSGCLTISFHEYAGLVYIEGNYKAAWDEGYLYLAGPKGTALHWHITEDAEALEIIMDFFAEDCVFVESTNWYAFYRLRAMKRKTYEKRKGRYLGKKYLRIYTMREILQRSEK